MTPYYKLDSHGKFIEVKKTIQTDAKEYVQGVIGGRKLGIRTIKLGDKMLPVERAIDFLNHKLLQIKYENKDNNDIKTKLNKISLLKKGLIFGSSKQEIEKIFQFVVAHSVIEKMDPNKFDVDLATNIVNKKLNSISKTYKFIKNIEGNFGTQLSFDNIEKFHLFLKENQIKESDLVILSDGKPISKITSAPFEVILDSDQTYQILGFPHPKPLGEGIIWDKNFANVMKALIVRSEKNIITAESDGGKEVENELLASGITSQKEVLPVNLEEEYADMPALEDLSTIEGEEEAQLEAESISEESIDELVQKQSTFLDNLKKVEGIKHEIIKKEDGTYQITLIFKNKYAVMSFIRDQGLSEIKIENNRLKLPLKDAQKLLGFSENESEIFNRVMEKLLKQS